MIEMEQILCKYDCMQKKIIVIGVSIIAVIIMLLFVNFLPTFSLETSDMTSMEGEWINVFYEKEKAAAEDVFQYADSETKQIAYKLGFKEKQGVDVYIYDKQSTMQRKKYGLVASFMGLDWYIGDNRGTNVILTSPANPGKEHSYDDVKDASLHEIVHAYVSVINPDVQLWLTEGVALYLTNGEPLTKEIIDSLPVPTYKETRTSSPIAFSKCGGYTYAHTYIEYLETEYGWDKVLELLKNEDYEKVLGKSSKEIYNDWLEFLESHQ